MKAIEVFAPAQTGAVRSVAARDYAGGGGHCPHCRRMREDLDEAREMARQLREQAFGAPIEGALKQRWALAPSEATILGVLLSRETARKEALLDALYFDDPNGGAEEKILSVFICRMRPRLKRDGVLIETVWGVGWRLAPEMKARVRALLAEAKGER